MMSRPFASRLNWSHAVGLMLALLSGVLLFSTCYGEDTTPLTITEGLRLATENNRVIRIAARDKDISFADTQIARARYLPVINTSLNQTFLANQPAAIFGHQSVPTGEKSSLSYVFDVRQILYDFGARSSQYEAARTGLDEAKLNIERVRNIVALDFIITYFDLLETKKLELVAGKEAERLAAHLETARDLYAEGVITKNDLLQSEVRLSDARQRLITIRNSVSVISSRINNILSKPLGSPVNAVDVAQGLPPEPDLERSWAIAENQRIEIRVLDNELRINSLEETAKRSENYPRFFAETGFNYTENRYLTHQGNWALILGLDMNLFNGGGTKAELSKILYKRERILEQKRKLEDDIRLDVEKGYFDMKNARERIAVTRDAIAQADENLKINRVRYSEGVGTSTDVLDAITLLTTAETNYYRAIYELRRAHGAFMYATGMDLASEYR